MKIKALIIGYGSSGKRYYKILSKSKKINTVKIFSRRNNIDNCLNNYDDIKKYNPDLIIISTETSDHYSHFLKIESIFKNKKH